MRSSKLSRFAGFALGIAGVCAFALPSVAATENADTRFETMDADGDGKISPDEHTAAATRMFDTMDANKDGKVTAAEMDGAQQKLLGKKHVKSAKGEMTAAEKIKIIDTNGDGVLTQDELSMAAMAMFEKMDTDKDSFLTKCRDPGGPPEVHAQPAKSSGGRPAPMTAAGANFYVLHSGIGRNGSARGGRRAISLVLPGGYGACMRARVLRGIAHASLLFAVAHLPGGPRAYHAVTRGLLRSQRRVIQKLRRVWPGLAARLARALRSRSRRPRRSGCMNPAGFRSRRSPAYLLSGRGGVLTSTADRPSDRYVSATVRRGAGVGAGDERRGESGPARAGR